MLSLRPKPNAMHTHTNTHNLQIGSAIIILCEFNVSNLDRSLSNDYCFILIYLVIIIILLYTTCGSLLRFHRDFKP